VAVLPPSVVLSPRASNPVPVLTPPVALLERAPVPRAVLFTLRGENLLGEVPRGVRLRRGEAPL
jgi:hypothetical protein